MFYRHIGGKVGMPLFLIFILLVQLFLPFVPVGNAEPIESVDSASWEDNLNPASVKMNNDLIGYTVNGTGQISIGTSEGINLLYGYPHGTTSYPTIGIDGETFQFRASKQTVNNKDLQVKNVMSVNGVEIIQEISIVRNSVTQKNDQVLMKYTVTNTNDTQHEVGLRMMLDTMIGNNDGAPFRVPGVGNITREAEISKDSLPNYFHVVNNLENPTIVAQGSFGEVKPDYVQFTNWGNVYGNDWDYQVNGNFIISDSAIVAKWNEGTFKANETKTFTMYYGLSEFNSESSDGLVINAAADREVEVKEGNYSPNPFQVTAYIINAGEQLSSNTNVTIELPEGLTLVDSNETIEIGDLEIGQEKQVSWEVAIEPHYEQKDYRYAIKLESDTYNESQLDMEIHVPAIEKSYFIPQAVEEAVSAIEELLPINELTLAQKDKVEQAMEKIDYVLFLGGKEQDISNFAAFTEAENKIHTIEESVEKAVNAISELPSSTSLKYKDKYNVEHARALVEEAFQQGAVMADLSNMEKLTELESELANMEEILNQVVQAIEAIPENEELKYAHSADIELARQKVDQTLNKGIALEDITNIGKLEDSEVRIQEIIEIVVSANESIANLPSIEELKLKDKQLVEEARNKIDEALSFAVEEDFDQLPKLVELETRISEIEEALKSATEAISALPSISELRYDMRTVVEEARQKVEFALSFGASESDIESLEQLEQAEDKINLMTEAIKVASDAINEVTAIDPLKLSHKSVVDQANEKVVAALDVGVIEDDITNVQKLRIAQQTIEEIQELVKQTQEEITLLPNIEEVNYQTREQLNKVKELVDKALQSADESDIQNLTHFRDVQEKVSEIMRKIETVEKALSEIPEISSLTEADVERINQIRVSVDELLSLNTPATEIDGYQKLIEAEEYLKIEPDDGPPLRANAGEDRVTEEGLEITFNAEKSTPANQISRYVWDFGDGNTAEGNIVTHTYNKAGTYTATLTIYNDKGETTTDTVSVEVSAVNHDKDLKIKVVDKETKAPIRDANVMFEYAGGSQEQFTTDHNGQVSVTVGQGTYKIYGYKKDYRPGVITAQVEDGKERVVTIELESGQVALGDLEVKRLTLEEIKEAGIDVNDPANQNVYEFKVVLEYGEKRLSNKVYVNESGNFVGTPASFPLGDGRKAIPYVFWPIEGDYEKSTPSIAYLIIPGEARWLKEFFEVSLVMENAAGEGFDITDSEVELKLPEGLVLAPTNDEQNLKVDLGVIAGGESVLQNWIIRGDKKGEYNIEAAFKGMLQPFGQEVQTVFETKDPIKVWGEDMLEMYVVAPSRTVQGVPIEVKFGIKNKSNIPAYNVTLELKEEGRVGYDYAPGQSLTQMISVLQAGDIEWFTYTLIPYKTGTFNLNASDIIKTGGNADIDAEIVYYSPNDARDLLVFSHLSYFPFSAYKGVELKDIPLFKAEEFDKLSEDLLKVYSQDDMKNVIEEVGDWEVLDHRDIGTSNFNGTAFKNGKDIVIAFRGSQQAMDWFLNLGIAFQGFHLQVLDGIVFVNDILKNYPDHNITLTGHSLGGFIAQATTYELLRGNLLPNNDFNFVGTSTFNAPGFTTGFLSVSAGLIDGSNTCTVGVCWWDSVEEWEALEHEFSEDITNYIIKNDPVGETLGLAYHVGRKAMLDQIIVDIHEHSIINFYPHFESHGSIEQVVDHLDDHAPDDGTGDEEEDSGEEPAVITPNIANDRASLTDEMVEKFLGQENPVLDLSTMESQQKVYFDVTTEQLKQLKEQGVSFELHRDDVRIQIPTSNLNENYDVSISMERLPNQKGSYSTAYSFKIIQNNQYVSTFNEPVTLMFPVNMNDEEVHPEDLKVYYIDENGQFHLIGGTYKDGFIEAKTDHFSTFAVFHPEALGVGDEDEAGEPETDPNEGEESPEDPGTDPDEGEESPEDPGTDPGEGEESPEDPGTDPDGGEKSPEDSRTDSNGGEEDSEEPKTDSNAGDKDTVTPESGSKSVSEQLEESEKSIEKEKVQTSKGEIPNTAMNHYNYLLFGILLLSAGILVRRKWRRSL